MKILITGGAGYIGSHTVKELLKTGRYEVLVFDNLSTGKKESVLASARLVVGDLGSLTDLAKLFKENKFDAVIHFAASKDAAESVLDPGKYYNNNVVNSLNLLNAMVGAGVKNIIFSSTAAVYGGVKKVPIDENTPAGPVNPYGQTKLMFEKILADYEKAYGINYVSLRYFNVAGADIEGKLGCDFENGKDLVSVLMRVALGKEKKFIINGTDYKTKDGTAIRDLIHVSDLALAHIKALEYLGKGGKSEIFNLGSEKGFTVRETAEAVKKVTEANFEIIEGPRRHGDVEASIASSAKAKKILSWEAGYSNLTNIIETSWNWARLSL